MRTTPRALRVSIIATTAAAAISLGAASGAVAATAQPAPVSVENTAHGHAAHGKKKRVYVKTVKLASKGHTAKVYKLGKGSYQADVLFHGKKFGTLTAKGRAASANLNGLHVKLTSGGMVSSWVDRAKPAPKPKPKPTPTPKPKPVNKRELVRIDTLVDGSPAKIYKLSAHHWQAEIGGDLQIGLLDADGFTDSAENNGIRVELTDTGVISSVRTDPTPAPDPDPVPDEDTNPPAPVPDEDPTPAPIPDEDTNPPTPVPDEDPTPAPVPDEDTTPPVPVPDDHTTPPVPVPDQQPDQAPVDLG
ncbi:hypothetical protein RCO28_22635 [Streptomyces sp. LHD-70]|uniref:hypothetical protein n=1 Tax=Streptomyces sp. LHD-70 TaxID=3072140 RepID=UPI00280F9A23|nr:hypothetical protein [Streptomyces sp. LHD-70]MDQ8705271.1 hypothetical protein [Streptomyces sp. LHD-70]